jgi:monoamine oxidase
VRDRFDPGRRRLIATAGLAAASGALAAPQAKGAESAGGVLDVVIIGAGLAGLTAARDLARAGNDAFVVLEARQRVGGRTLNHQLRDGYVSEAGGQWIGPGQTAVADLARELGVGTFKSEYPGKSVFFMGGGRAEIAGGGELGLDPAVVADLDALARESPSERPWTAPRAAELDRLSLGDWLDARKVSDLDRLTWQLASVLTTGAALSKVSLLYYLSMLNFAGGVQALEGQKNGAQETRLIGGSQILSLKMAKTLGERIRLGQAVTEIRAWDRPLVEVRTANGVWRARRVIVALSPTLCEQIRFTPDLPDGRRGLQQRWPAHGPLVKTATVYRSPFWFADGFSGQVFGGDGPVIWSYDNSPPDKRYGVINAFMRASEMPADPALAREAVTRVFARALKDRRFLDPLEFHVQDWGQEPFTLSCISPMPPGLLTSGLMPALASPIGGLVWAGTETADIWNGYMDGAVRSGHRAALLALQGLNADSGRRA